MTGENPSGSQARSSAAAPEPSRASESTPLLTRNEGGGGEGGGHNATEGSLGMKQAAVLIAGEMVGPGVLALPRTLAKTGWLGVPIIVLMCAIAGYGGMRLGQCWSILEARDPDMRTRRRNPYALIAQHTLGKAGSIMVNMCIVVTLFGAGVVCLLLAAELLDDLLRFTVPTVKYCGWFLIIAVTMTPTLWLGTPKDFPYLGIAAFLSTIAACILYFIQMLMEVKPFVFRYGLHGFKDFFLAFGTIMFAFGSASTFPTIRNDMANKKEFSTSILYAFTAILLLYLPIAITGYAVYGEATAPNIATSLMATPLTFAANVLMFLHLLGAFVMLISPVSVEMEELFEVEENVQWKRIAVRVGVMLFILFIGASVPKFSTILALIGGSTIALLTFVLPTYCYMKLSSEPAGDVPAQATPGWQKVISWEIITIGLVGGVLATAVALGAMFGAGAVLPCYL